MPFLAYRDNERVAASVLKVNSGDNGVPKVTVWCDEAAAIASTPLR